jgi:hypothetical protein
VDVLAADPAALDNMRTRASERVKQQFSLEVQRENFIRFYGA